MPATPFHLGPGFMICLALGSGACGAVLAGSVVPDIEPGLVMLLDLDARLHGPLHSLTSGLILGPVAGVLGSQLCTYLCGLPDRYRYSAILGIIGWILHVILDSFLYTDIQPFWPFSTWNPLLNALGDYTFLMLYSATGLTTIIGLLIILKNINRNIIEP